MPKLRNWVEVEDECIGPDRGDGLWNLLLVLTVCRSYCRRNGKRVTHRRRDVLRLSADSKISVLLAADAFLDRTDVIVVRPAEQRLRIQKTQRR